MSNNLSKLLVSAGVDLVVERALGIHQLLEGAVLDDVPRIQVDDVVGGLQVAEVVRDADRRRVFRELTRPRASRAVNRSSSSCIPVVSGSCFY